MTRQRLADITAKLAQLEVFGTQPLRDALEPDDLGNLGVGVQSGQLVLMLQ